MIDPTSSPRQPLFRSILLILLFVLGVLLVAGVLYENISEARDRRFNPAPGRLLMVSFPDGPSLRMHIYCAGEGTPTVILDSGLGDSYISWRKVQPQIAAFTRVCSYDRAGIGYSEPSARARTSEVIAKELRALLHAAGVSPPYILVGHSMGGYDVRVFAHQFPGEVAGMALIDASHPDQDKRLPPELRDMQGSWLRESEFLAYTMPFGIPRLMGLCDPDPDIRAADCNFRTALEGLAEMKAFPESASQAAAVTTLGDMPLLVLSHDPDKPSSELPPDLAKPTNDAWEKMQEESAHLSSRGKQSIVKGSAHYIQIDRPEAVVSGIRDVVDQARFIQTRQSPSAVTR